MIAPRAHIREGGPRAAPTRVHRAVSSSGRRAYLPRMHPPEMSVAPERRSDEGADRSRPVPVLVVAGAYLAVGIIGFVAHFHDLLATPAEGASIELTELLAAVTGIFLLRGQNWARWLAVAWIAFHVVLSAFGSIREAAMHLGVAMLIVWLLFRPGTTRWFHPPRAETV